MELFRIIPRVIKNFYYNIFISKYYTKFSAKPSIPQWNNAQKSYSNRRFLVIRLKHYSYQTEKTYIYWIRRYILFHDKRHPKDMGSAEIEAFLTSKLLYKY